MLKLIKIILVLFFAGYLFHFGFIRLEKEGLRKVATAILCTLAEEEMSTQSTISSDSFGNDSTERQFSKDSSP